MKQGGFGKEPEYRRQQKIAAERHQNTEQYEEIIRTIVALNTSIDSMTVEHSARRQQADHHETGKRLRDWATFGALVATAFAAILTLIVTHRDNLAIIEESRRTADQQHTDTLAALGKTDATISAIQGQADIMRDQLGVMKSELAIAKNHLQARMTRELAIENAMENGVIVGWRFTPVWQNIGATEARGFIGWNVLNVFKPDVPENFDFLHANPPDRVPITVDPRQTTLQATRRVSVNDATDAIAGQAVIIAWGYGEFRDIFPDTPTHHRHWCVKLLPFRRGNAIVFSDPIIYKQECNQSD